MYLLRKSRLLQIDTNGRKIPFNSRGGDFSPSLFVLRDWRARGATGATCAPNSPNWGAGLRAESPGRRSAGAPPTLRHRQGYGGYGRSLRHRLGFRSSSSRPAQGGGFVAFPVVVGRGPGPGAAWLSSVSKGLGFRPLRRALRALADARKGRSSLGPS